MKFFKLFKKNISYYLPKSMHIMRISLFLLFIVIAQLHAENTYSQKAVINLSLRNATVEQVLDQIEKNTDFSFLFTDKSVDIQRKVDIEINRKNINETLAILFKDTDVQYKIVDRQVILSNNKYQFESIHQVKRITGVVKDANGEPIIGANVVEKDSKSNGTITDLDGNFQLDVSQNATLVISFIGYHSQELAVANRSSLSVTLQEDQLALDEVVVVGYGVVKKKDLTGAVGALKGEDVAARKTTQLSTALQGAIAGVTVTRDNGAPGATSNIKVRGVTTIGNTDPLVIIDGVPGDMNQVNPNDVENISVLKDAASASIYGSRAAAGVILITTKRAKESDLTLGYNFEYGWEIPTKQPQYVGIQRYLEMTNELRYNDNNAGGMYQAYSQDQVENWVKYNATDPNNYPITDWKDLILKSSAPRQTHIFNITGGSKNVRTKASFTYDKIDGLYMHRYYERYMLRVNNDFSINKYLGATLDFNYKRSNTHQPAGFNPLDRMRIMPLVYAAVWDDGRVAEGKTGANPYGILKNGGTEDNWYNQIGGKASLDFKPIDGLTVSAVFAPVFNFAKLKSFRLAAPYTLANDPNTIGGYFEGHTTTKLTENRNDDYSLTSQAIATYLKTFGDHDLNIMGGYENYYYFNESLMASRDQYELTNYPYLDIGPLTLRDNSGSAYEIAYRSFFGRVIYNFKNKYLLQANIRRDGSSRFAKDYRWGNFPSFSAGWVISEESFMKKTNWDWLSFLKLRASYGTLGNERIGNYPYQATIGFSNVLFYQNGQPVSELSAAQWKYAIENISWETTESYDFGLDASFLNNRLRFSGDYYKKTTKDMLLALEIPDYVGFDNPDKNTGKMHTNGYELELSWNDQAGDFNYSAAINFSDFISKMGDLGGTEFLGDQVKMEGSEFNEWYGYKSDGLFLTQEDLDNSAKINSNVKVGDVKYVDISGPDGVPDGKISSEYDRVLLGGSLPRYMFGGNLSVGYKGLDLSLAFQGVGSQNVRLSSPMIEPLRENFGNIPKILDGKYWTSLKTDAENAKAVYPRLTRSNIGSNMAMSDFWMFNGRYVRLKNITLGYALPAALTQKISIQKARIYFSANDLFVISNFPEGWDPEMGTGSYPITTSLLFGLSVNF